MAINLKEEKKTYEFHVNKFIPYRLNCLNSDNPNLVSSAREGLHKDYLYLAACEYGLFNNLDKCKEYILLSNKYLQDYIYKYAYEGYLPLNNNHLTYMLVSSSKKDIIKYGEYCLTQLDWNQDLGKAFDDLIVFNKITLNLMQYGNKNTEIEKLLEEAKQYEKRSDYKDNEIFYRSTKAIVEKDEQKFHDIIEEMIAYYVKTRSRYAEGADVFLHKTALGDCRLAIHCGMQVNFDHKYLPKELIHWQID